MNKIFFDFFPLLRDWIWLSRVLALSIFLFFNSRFFYPSLTMSKSCNTCKKVINQRSSRYIRVTCNVHMLFEPSCSGLTQVAVNSLKEAGHLAILLCVKCLNNTERDNFIKCRTVDKMNEKFETETQQINKKLQTMEVDIKNCRH